MLHAIVAAIMAVGRVATFALGLAVLFGLVVGAGAGAQGQDIVGNVLRLGRVNEINEATRLGGRNTGTILRLENTGTGQALDLRVGAGRPPLTVNANGLVANLNADLLDGIDATAFAQARTAGTQTVNVLPIAGETCRPISLAAPDLVAGDAAFVYPAANLTAAGPLTVTVVRNPGTAASIPAVVCNSTDVTIDPPSGTWQYVVLAGAGT